MKQFLDYITAAIHYSRLPGYLKFKSENIFINLIKTAGVLFLLLLFNTQSHAQGTKVPVQIEASAFQILAPVNDNCSNAITVIPGDCVDGTTVDAVDNWQGTIGCQSGNNHPEVWYTFIATGNTLDVNVTALTLTGNIEFVLVSSTGPCSGLFNTGTICGPSPLTGTINGLQAGQRYYYTISSSTSSQGTFRSCITNTTPPPLPGQDCDNAAILCNSNTFSQPTSDAGFGTQEINQSNSCFNVGGERQSKWFKFTAGSTGPLMFNINPVNSNDDYDWAVFDVTAGCTNKGNSIACNWSGCTGSTGLSNCPDSEPGSDKSGAGCAGTYSAWANPITVTAGNTYALLVDNFSTSNQGFTLTFGGACNTSTAIIGPDATFTSSASDCNTYNFSKTNQTTNSSFLWQFGDGTSSTSQNTLHSFTAAGTYIVSLEVTDALGCVATYSETIDINTSPSPTANIEQPSCVNNTGSITVITPAPAAGISYSIDGNDYSNTTGIFTNLIPGNYSLTSKDAADCISVPLDVTINTSTSPPDPPQITVQYNCSGTATMTATGIEPGATILWSTGETTNPIEINTTGTITVTQTLNGCTSEEGSVNIDAFSGLIIRLTYNNVLCYGGNTGRLVIDPLQGTPPYSYTITPGFGPVIAGSFSDDFERIDGLIAGTYQVSVTDANNCTFSESRTIIQPATALNASVSTTSAVCSGDWNGTATVTATGGTAPYTYSLNGVTFVPGNVFNNLPAGSYNATTKDRNNCTTVTSFSIDEPDELIISPVVSPAICTNENGSIKVNVTGGTSPYTYSINGGAQGSNNVFDDLAAGFYAVSVIDNNGCSKTIGVSIDQFFPILSVNGMITPSICTSNTGAIELVVNNGELPYTFQWNGPEGFNETTQNISGLKSGWYMVNVTDINGCITSESFFVDQVATSISIEPVLTNADCTAANGAIDIELNGGLSPYNFTWSGPDNFSSTQQNINNLLPGNYTLFAVDANGCITGGSFNIISVITNLNINEDITGATCLADNGSINISVSNGTAPYNFNWTGTDNYISSIEDPNNLKTGNYSLTVTDKNGCTDQKNYYVPQITSSITVTPELTNANCSAGNGAIDIIVNGGTAPYNFEWSGPGNFYSTQQDISGLFPGSYNLNIIDANGCTSGGFYIISPEIITLNFDASVTNTNCTANNGAIDLSVTNGTPPYIYSWSGPGGYTSGVEDPSGLAAGTYDVTITDKNGCTGNTTVRVQTAPNTLGLTYQITGVDCRGQNGAIDITVTGGTVPYQYEWSSLSGSFSSTEEDAKGLVFGSYSVRITDFLGCTYTANIIVNQALSPLALQASAVAASCKGNDGSIDLTVTGGAMPYTYVWTGPGGYSFNGEDPSGIGGGTYSVVITDANTCTVTAAIEVNQINSTLAPSWSVVDAFCTPNSGSIDLGVVGGDEPYTYSWSNGASTQDLNNIPAGFYTVLITDTKECFIEIEDIEVGISGTVLNATVTVNNIICGQITGSISIDVLSGTAPYSYSIDAGVNFQNNKNFNNLPAGQYNVITKDANDCILDTTVIINDPPPTIIPTFDPITSLCEGSIAPNLPQISLNNIPGTWSPATINTGTPGITVHTFTPNGNQCAATTELIITVNANTSSNTNASVCSSQLPYVWNGQSYNAAGTYDVTLTSSLGCDSVATLNLALNPDVTSITNTSICSSGLPYQWNGQTYNAAGTYDVTLTSSLGCDSVATLNLTVNPDVTSETNISVCSSALPYLWNGQSYNAAGSYDVTLTSALGCDSVATLNLSVNPDVTSVTNTSICSSALPYLWNGQSYNAAGSYDVTLTSALGCDSVATLNLSVNPDVTSITNTSVCSSALPYLWNGQSYNVAGSYDVTLTSALGCDSVATLNLVVNPDVTSVTNIAVCSSVLPYLWNGQSYNAAGSYDVTLTSVLGCDSVATLNLTVNPDVTSITNASVCSSALPYLWNGQSYNAGGTYDVTLTSALGCDSVATLNLTINPDVTSITNTSICSSALPYLWNGQSYNAAGTYDVTLTSTLGCDSVATLNLAVNPDVSSITNTSICSSALPYQWNGQSYNAAGTYDVTLTSSLGCDSVATLNLAVNQNVTSSTDQTICTAQLPYNWNGQNITQAGTYTATLTATSGCDSIARLNLTVNQNVTSTTNQTICTAQLPYQWNGQNITQAGTYTATLTSSSGCDSVTTLNLSVNPNVTSTTDLAICTAQLPYQWNGQNITQAGTYTATLTAASGCDSIATLNLSVNPNATSTTDLAICTAQLPYQWNGQNITQAGTYTTTLTAASGCDSIATLNLTVNQNVTSTKDQAICTAQLPYSWNGQSITQAGTYTATLTAALGCDSIATLNLAVNQNVTSTTDQAICTAQLPYTWNGQSITQAGTYTATLTAASGCDSIATLNLTVNQNVTSTTDQAICTAQLPYSWNGQSITQAGTYTATLTAASGCDSIATLNLAVNPNITSTTDQAICTAQLPYSWNGQSITQAGTYTATLTAASGCDSVATLNLTVNPNLTSTTDQTICTAQLPYNWNGQSITQAGTYTATLTAASGCDSIATLNLTVNQNVTSTNDQAICTAQLPYTWNGQSITQAGTYTATLTAASGCDSVATLNLTVNQTVTSTTDQAICTAQLPYTWNGQSITQAGTYTTTLTAASGCDSIATLNLVVNQNVTSTTDQTICTAQLPYTWNGQSITQAGTYTATLTAASGCDSIATLNLTVNQNVTSTTDQAICTAQLPYTWNGQSITQAGTYTATLTAASGCDSIATLNLSVIPNQTSTTDQAICTAQLPYTWNGQNITQAGTYTATLTAASGCDSIATLNLAVNQNVTTTTDQTICTAQLPYTWNGQSITQAGTYTAILTAASGCDSIATLNLTINQNVTSTTNQAICTAQLPYTWNGQSITQAGTYTATLTAASGCDSITTLNLTVNQNVTSTTDQTICTAQLPYTWNGQSITQTGTYTATLTAASGCDSVATLNLVVNQNVTSTTDQTICTAQLPYTWNGKSITQAGTYTAALIAASGCDSIATLNLTVNQNVTSTTDQTICSAQLPYTWNGQSITQAGTYTATLTAASGCDSISTLNLTVNQNVTSTTDQAICTAQLPYTWNGQSITQAGTYTATLTAASGCDSITTLNLTVNQNVTSITNTSICSSKLPYQWNGQSITQAGTYPATLTAASGCDSIATLNLTVNQNVTSTTDQTICTAQLPYAWNGQSITQAGTYTATLSAASGCDSIATLNLTVNQNVTSTTDQAICTAQFPFIWNGQSITQAGTYTATLTAASGCDSITTLNLTVNQNVTSITNTSICSSELPYQWNGQSITQAGTYTATLTAASGCDSIATLNLTVNQNVTSTTDQTICTAQLPYAWNGQSITQAGTYTATLTAASGCDSIATLNLVVNQNVTSTTDQSICTAQLPYAWNGQSITQAGNYTATLTAASGCDSIATLNLTVNPNVTSTTDQAICTAQLPYTWNGQSITQAGTYTATLTAASGCDSIATLNLSVNQNVTSTTDQAICTAQLPYTWNGQSITQAGTYTATLTAASGCDSIATLNLSVNQNVTSTTDQAICTAQLPYTWNGQSITQAGTYTATLTAASGCDSIATLNLTVNQNVTSTTDQAICTAQLPYNWNGQSITQAGTYTATLTAASGCDSVATLNLTVNQNVTSTTDQTICTAQLPYAWNGQSITQAGTYTTTLTAASGCDSIATLNLAVNQNITSTTDQAICTAQLPYTWNGQSITQAGTYSATLTTASGCDSIATLNLSVNQNVTSTTDQAICTAQLPYTWNGQSITQAGTYTATLTAASGCDSIATLNLSVNQNVTSTTDQAICTAQLPYTWNGQSITQAGTYTATLTAASGCDSIATLNLAVNQNITSTTDQTICTAQLPYTWNGQSITQAGTYTATLTAASGCDSIATLNLTVNQNVTSITDQAICTAQLPYTWNGQSITQAGTYTTTLTAASGCDSIATLNLTVNQNVTSTTDQSICTAQLPYTWNGQSITQAGTYTTTLTAASGCDSVATLNLTVSQNVTSTTDQTICTAQLPYAWNGQSITQAGTYTVTLTAASGCDSIATLNLIVYQNLTSNTDQAICTAQLPYTWNGQSITQAGTYTATLTGVSGCDSIATLNLSVNPNLTSTTNLAICTAQLPYAWNGQSITQAGTYTATLTAVSGCDSIATLNLSVNPNLTSTTNQAICTAQLPYTWNGQSITQAGNYTATLTAASGCDSIATLNLSVNQNVTSTTDQAICTAQLPYTWNGQSITQAGTYTATLTSASGCDSIATLNLTVNQNVTSTTDQTICTAQLPYTWNGQSITQAGTYTATLTAASDCDSVATLNLTVDPNLTSTTDQTICTSQIPYTWNGQSITQAGTYTATLTAASGCDSIATLNLAVNQNITSTTDQAICTAQLPYTWNGQNITQAGTYTATLIAASGCDSIATLNLAVNQNVTSTTDQTICTAQLPYTWNGQSITQAGTYTATLTATSGCDSIATLNLTVNQNITSTTDQNICTAQLPYSWNGQSITQAGTYTATLTAASGCDSIATLNLVVNQNVTSTTDQTICSAQLPYTWNGQSITQAGIYTTTLTAASGCDSIATLNLTVNQNVTSTTDQAICTAQLPYAWNGQSITQAGTYTATLTAVSGCDSIATLNLSVNPNLTSTTNQAICTAQLPYAWNGQSITQAGTYTATLNAASGCDSVATLNLTVNQNVTSTTDQAICTAQLPYSWNGQSITQAGTYTATLTAASGCDSIATLNLTVNQNVTSTTDQSICTAQLPYTWNGQSITQAGTYTATLTAASGCDSIITLNLVVNQIPGIRYSSVTASSYVPLQLNARNIGSDYIWTPSVGLNADNINNPIFNYNIETDYTIQITTDHGCVTVDSILVRINNEIPVVDRAELFVPKAWSPNNDGYNDKLYPLGLNIKELKYFRVFNRWGQLMYETNIIGQGWDGTFKGNPQIMDIYYWTAEAIGLNGQYYKRSGSAVLLR